MVATAPLRPARRLGRPKAELSLTDEERSALERLARRRTSAQAAALRARIILSCATGAPNTAVAEVLGVAPATVGKWRRRFVAARLDGQGDGQEPEFDQLDLAGLRAAAAPGRELQALDRPAVCREGSRRRWPVPRSARAGGRAVRRREEPDPGACPLSADPADAPGHARAAQSRLRPPRHHQPVRRA